MNHSYYMKLALDLAVKGWPAVAPNPLVGCVIVYNDKVVSSGYHQRYGEQHAEVNAINNLSNEILPENCILYVTLEPCSHFGKTPPCANLIIEKGFKTVVIACKDPNPLVSGNGVAILEEAGIKVISGILEQEARKLNKRFFTFFENKRPYFILKWAQTADGFISRVPIPKNKNENKITRQAAQIFVHALRAESMGIFVGKNTVLNDDPSLTTRLVKGKNATRIFIDNLLEVPSSFNIFNEEAETIVFNGLKEEKNGNIQFKKIDFSSEILPQIFEKLFELNIQSVLVEGGSLLINDFVNKGIWDEVLVFQNPDLHFGAGIKAPVFALKNTFELVGDDKLFHHHKNEALLAEGFFNQEIF